MAIQQSINKIKYELALFAGSGGGILGGRLLGHRCIGAVEWESYPVCNLVGNQNNGCLEPFPIWDDVRTFTIGNKECKEYIEWLYKIRGNLTISGGFPCQDISSAGKGKGITGKRSSMWNEMARIISEIRPAIAFVENSPMLIHKGLAMVLGDFAEMGYDARWGIVGADDAGAWHERKRIWIMGYAELR